MRQTAPFVIRDLVEEALRTAAPAVNMNKVHHAPPPTDPSPLIHSPCL